jgi:hypothetical protein
MGTFRKEERENSPPHADGMGIVVKEIENGFNKVWTSDGIVVYKAQ